LNVARYYTHGNKICFYILSVVMLNCTQVFRTEEGENCGLTE